jgi:hypothetical protein
MSKNFAVKGGAAHYAVATRYATPELSIFEDATVNTYNPDATLKEHISRLVNWIDYKTGVT